jgi:thiol-disulfide isomerase/thioredoxin
MKIRNLLVLASLFSIPITCFSQDANQRKAFTLNGQITDPKLDSVSILYINDQGKVSREVIPTIKGMFKITGSISQPKMAYILFIHKGEKLNRREAEIKTDKVFIEPAEMLITEEADANGFVKVKGSRSQNEWNDLKAKTRSAQLTIDTITKLYPSEGHGTGSEAIRELAPYRAKLAKINYDFFYSHPNSYVTANQMMFFTSVFGLDTLKQLYDRFTPQIKASIDGKRLAAEIRSQTAGRPGSVAFAFNVKDKDGKELALAAFKGKYVLLDFWATWCVPCRASMPKVIALYHKYKDKGFDVIAIGDDDKNVPNWLAAIDHDGTGMFHQTLRGMDIDMARKGISNPRDLDVPYGIHALPTQILINPDGEIIGRFTGNDEDLAKMLTSVFKF